MRVAKTNGGIEMLSSVEEGGLIGDRANMSAMLGDQRSGVNVQWQSLVCKAGKVEILHGVGGSSSPGELVVLLGPSGSGKSTLLSVLSGRFFGKLSVSGKLEFNGGRYTKAMKRRIGYCEQDDVLLGDLTVRQTLEFAAALRGQDAYSERAGKMIAALGLNSCADSHIGGANIDRCISGGQRKRCSIGVELLLDPDVLLLDESTSGLDSSAAARIVDLLRQVADAGRTVIASLHQPNDFMYSSFDKVGILAAGKSAYFGRADQAAETFEAALGTTRKRLVPVADFLLDVVTHVEMIEEEPFLEDISDDSGADDEIARANWWLQFRLLSKRSFLAHRLDVVDNLFLATITIITTAVSLLWFRRAAARPRTYEAVDDVSGLFFFVAVFFAFQLSLAALFAFPPDLALLKKERSAGLYKLSAFFLARTLVDTATSSLVAPCCAFVYYFLVGLRPSQFGIHWLAMLVNGLVAHSAGLLLSASFRNLKKAATMLTITMLISMVAGGYYVSHVPVFLRWLQSISFLKYSYAILMKLEYKGARYECEDDGERRCKVMDDHDAFDDVDINRSIAFDFAILIAFFFAFRIAAYFALRHNAR